MEINWQVSDGYVGNRPQSFEIDDDEILDCDSVEDAMELIEEMTREEFLKNISWNYDDEWEIRAEVEKLFAKKAKEDE